MGTYLEQFTEIDEVKLILVCKHELTLQPRYVLHKVTDMLVILTSGQICLVVDRDFNLCCIPAELDTLGLLDFKSIEDILGQVEGQLPASLDQEEWVCVDRKLFWCEGRHQLYKQLAVRFVFALFTLLH